MVNSQDQNMIVWRAAQIHDSIKRSLDQIERSAENFSRQLFHRFRAALFGGHFAIIEIDSSGLSDYLERTFLAAQDRETQNLLPIDHALNGRTTLGFSQKSANVEQTANVICVVLDRDRRGFPKFALRKRQRMKL